jgi:succinoglycan biosynthesis protein ExoM
VTSPIPHISVCVCTCQRPQLLKRLLTELLHQETAGLFTYSIVVADNDASESAKPVVKEVARTNPVKITYCVETRRNIALVRNKALEYATGNLVAFIDDDEWPTEDWLRNLFRTWMNSGSSGVLGPVVPHYETEPPHWVQVGRFHERPRYATGFELDWSECRTGNVMFAKKILTHLREPFRSQFGTTGEDKDFFRRLIEAGHKFVWCDEAVVYETVPPVRLKRAFMLQRALVRGAHFSKHPQGRVFGIVKSIVAVPTYTLMLPFLQLVGHHHFMRYMIKWCDHTGRLLAVLGVKLINRRRM